MLSNTWYSGAVVGGGGWPAARDASADRTAGALEFDAILEDRPRRSIGVHRVHMEPVREGPGHLCVGEAVRRSDVAVHGHPPQTDRPDRYRQRDGRSVGDAAGAGDDADPIPRRDQAL